MDYMDDMDNGRVRRWGVTWGAVSRRGKKPAFIAVKTGRRVRAVRLDAGAKTAPQTRTLGVGQSMAPVLLPGDRAELRQLSGPPSVGAIVTFERAGRLITHRVIKVHGSQVWARGDNSPALEGPLPLDCIAGEVVAFVRDGKRHELSGNHQRMFGLLRNHAMAALRDFAGRYPRLRRAVEIDVLSSAPARKCFGLLVKKLLGDVEVTEETDNMKKLSYVLKASAPPAEKTVSWLERKLKKGELRAFTARFSRRPVVAGSVVLVEDDYDKFFRTGYVGWLLVQLGFRGTGVGRKLLEALEKAARESGREILIAEVRPENIRSLGLFESLGYTRVRSEEMKKWPRELTERLPQDHIVLANSASGAK